MKWGYAHQQRTATDSHFNLRRLSVEQLGERRLNADSGSLLAFTYRSVPIGQESEPHKEKR
jgi:hypothetical protein